MNQDRRWDSELKLKIDLEATIEQVVRRSVGQFVIGKLDVIVGQVLPDQRNLPIGTVQPEPLGQTRIQTLVAMQVALSDGVERR